MKCLAKDRTRRYETANGLAADIQRHLNNELVVARPPSQLYRFQKMVRRNRVAFAACAAIATGLVLGLAIATWALVKEQQARRETERERRQAVANEKKAKAEGAKSQQVSEFLTAMLNGVGPYVALGRDTTLLREILDKTAERVGKDLTNQPEVEAELRTVIGEVYQDLGEYEKAEIMHREALRIHRTLLQDKGPEAAASLEELATALMGRGKLAEAESLAREALAMEKKLFGNDDDRMAYALSTLGNILENKSELPEAERVLREALAVYEKGRGKEHPYAAKAMVNLTTVLIDRGRLAEAEGLLRNAVIIQRKLWGNEHPDVAFSLNNLGNVLRDERKLDEAQAIHREALDMWKKLLGEEHPYVAVSLGNLADVFRLQGNLTEAERVGREALAIRKKALGAEHPNVAVSLADLAETVGDQGRFADAEAMYRDALAIQEKSLPDNWETFDTRSKLGASLLNQKRYAEAEPLVLSGYRGMKEREDRIPAQDIGLLRDAIKRVVWLYESTDRVEQAAEWIHKLIAFDTPETKKTPAIPSAPK